MLPGWEIGHMYGCRTTAILWCLSSERLSRNFCLLHHQLLRSICTTTHMLWDSASPRMWCILIILYGPFHLIDFICCGVGCYTTHNLVWGMQRLMGSPSCCSDDQLIIMCERLKHSIIIMLENDLVAWSKHNIMRPFLRHPAVDELAQTSRPVTEGQSC